VTYEGERKPLFLDVNPSFGTKDYSEETAREIDTEVKKIIDETYLRVKELLSEKRDLLEKVAQTLLEKETIDGEALRQLIKDNNGEKIDDKP
jgi:cell division protease FtsH